MANPVVGIDVTARLDAFREELKKVPDIGAKEARGLVTQLSREIKRAEKEAKRAAGTSQRATKAQRQQAQATIKSWGDVAAAIKPATLGAGVFAGALVGAGAGGAAALALVTREAFRLSDELNVLQKSADAVGADVEEFQRFGGAMEILTKGGVDGAQAIGDFQRKTGEALPDLEALADELAAFKNPADATRRAMELFGEEAGRKLAGALRQGSGAVRDAIAATEAAGLATREQTAQAEALQDATFLLGKEWDSLRREVLVPLMPALVDTAEFIGDVIAAARQSGLGEFAADLGDVAAGATLAARALFGLDQERRQELALSEAGQAAIVAQVEEIERLQGALEDWTNLESSNATALAARPGEIAKISKELEHERTVLRRLRGELSADIPGLRATTGPAPAPSGGGSGIRTIQEREQAERAAAQAARERQQAAEAATREEERQVKAAVVAYDELSTAVAAAQLAELSGISRVQAERDASLSQLAEQLEVVLQSEAASQAQKLAAEQQFEAGRIAIIAAASEQIDSIREQSHRDELDRIQQREEAERAATQQILGAYSGLAGGIGDLASAIGDAVASSAAEGSEAQLQAMREAWGAETAMALLQAGINIPLAISQALASGPPPANLVLAGISGAAAGAAFAAVAVKAAAGPPFHRGGVQLQRDETVRRFRQGEAALSQTGVAAAGGPQAVHAMNRGEGGGSGGPIYVVNTLDGRVLDVHSHEQLRRPGSSLSRAVRGAKSRKVGNARIWST